MATKKRSTTATKTLSYSVSPVFQKYFVLFVLGSLLAQVITFLYYISQVSSGGFSNYFGNLIDLLLPVLFFALAYFGRTSKLPQNQRVFESIFLMTIGIFVAALISQLFNFLDSHLSLVGNGILQSQAYGLTANAVSVLLYSAVVLQLQPKKK